MFYCWGAFRGADAESVYRADDTLAPEPIEDVGVDHRRLDVLVAEQLLDGADVVAGHKQVGGKGMPPGFYDLCRRGWSLCRGRNRHPEHGAAGIRECAYRPTAESTAQPPRVPPDR